MQFNILWGVACLIQISAHERQVICVGEFQHCYQSPCKLELQWYKLHHNDKINSNTTHPSLLSQVRQGIAGDRASVVNQYGVNRCLCADCSSE